MGGILVGFDGSDHSRLALEWAVREAALRRAALTVLTVHQFATGFWGGAVAYPSDEDLAEHARKTAQEETALVLDQLGDDSRPSSVTVISAAGLPGEEILRAGADADMIVVGARGAGGFKKLLVGSVTSQVTRYASCPVVVIPSGDR